MPRCTPTVGSQIVHPRLSSLSTKVAGRSCSTEISAERLGRATRCTARISNAVSIRNSGSSKRPSTSIRAIHGVRTQPCVHSGSMCCRWLRSCGVSSRSIRDRHSCTGRWWIPSRVAAHIGCQPDYPRACWRARSFFCGPQGAATVAGRGREFWRGELTAYRSKLANRCRLKTGEQRERDVGVRAQRVGPVSASRSVTSNQLDAPS